MSKIAPLALAVLAALGGSAVAADREPRKVAIVVFPGVELLDFAGPGEVLAASGFRVYTVAETRRPIVSQGFLTVVPEFSVDDAPAPDIVVIPGGSVGSIMRSPALMAWLQRAIAKDELTMSVCNGAIALAKTGALAGKKATSHWSALAALREIEPTATVVGDVRFVDNGRVMTTAGVSAGIDGSLHVVERLLGEEAAWATARYMQYNWEPPPGAVAEAERSAIRSWIMNDWPSVAREYQKLVERDPKDCRAQARLATAEYRVDRLAAADASAAKAGGLTGCAARDLEALANAQGAAKRLAEAGRTLARAADSGGPAVDHYNAACFHALAGQRDEAFAQLRQAIAGGFRDRATLENDGDLASLRADARFAKLLEEL